MLRASYVLNHVSASGVSLFNYLILRSAGIKKAPLDGALMGFNGALVYTFSN